MKTELVPGRCKECPHCRMLARPEKKPVYRSYTKHEDFIRAVFTFDGDTARIARAFDMTTNAVRTRKNWLRRRGVDIPRLKGGGQPTDVVNLNKLVKELKKKRAKRRLRNPDSGDEAGDEGSGLRVKAA